MSRIEIDGVRYLTLAQAAVYLGYHVVSVRRLVSYAETRKELGVIMLGHMDLVSIKRLQRFKRSLTKAPRRTK
jgi:hypothetical protein